MSQVSDVNWAALISGVNLRTEGNDIYAALLSLFSGSSGPSLTTAFMLNALTGTPNEVRIRNPADNAWLKFMELTDSAATLFSGGAQVLALNNTSAFTENQTVDKSGSAGIVTVRSDLATGTVASLRLGGENASASDVDGLFLNLRLVTATAGAEDFEVDIVVVRGGTPTTIATLGSTYSVTGTLNAGTLQQGGTDVDSVIADDLSSTRGETTFTTSQSITSQGTAGFLYRKTGSGAATVTLGSQPRDGSWAIFVNDSNGTGDITFASASSPNDVDIDGGATLAGASGQRPQCVVTWMNGGDDVNIRGDNT